MSARRAAFYFPVIDEESLAVTPVRIIESSIRPLDAAAFERLGFASATTFAAIITEKVLPRKWKLDPNMDVSQHSGQLAMVLAAVAAFEAHVHFSGRWHEDLWASGTLNGQELSENMDVEDVTLKVNAFLQDKSAQLFLLPQVLEVNVKHNARAISVDELAYHAHDKSFWAKNSKVIVTLRRDEIRQAVDVLFGGKKRRHVYKVSRFLLWGIGVLLIAATGFVFGPGLFGMHGGKRETHDEVDSGFVIRGPSSEHKSLAGDQRPLDGLSDVSASESRGGIPEMPPNADGDIRVSVPPVGDKGRPGRPPDPAKGTLVLVPREAENEERESTRLEDQGQPLYDVPDAFRDFLLNEWNNAGPRRGRFVTLIAKRTVNNRGSSDSGRAASVYDLPKLPLSDLYMVAKDVLEVCREGLDDEKNRRNINAYYLALAARDSIASGASQNQPDNDRRAFLYFTMRTCGAVPAPDL